MTLLIIVCAVVAGAGLLAIVIGALSGTRAETELLRVADIQARLQDEQQAALAAELAEADERMWTDRTALDEGSPSSTAPALDELALFDADAPAPGAQVAETGAGADDTTFGDGSVLGQPTLFGASAEADPQASENPEPDDPTGTARHAAPDEDPAPAQDTASAQDSVSTQHTVDSPRDSLPDQDATAPADTVSSRDAVAHGHSVFGGSDEDAGGQRLDPAPIAPVASPASDVHPSDARSAYQLPLTIDEAHELMQQHRTCDSGECASKTVAHRTLIEAGYMRDPGTELAGRRAC